MDAPTINYETDDFSDILKKDARFDPATAERPWAQIVGGGPEMTLSAPDRFPTVVEGKVAGGELKITVHNIKTGSVQAEHAFKPRA